MDKEGGPAASLQNGNDIPLADEDAQGTRFLTVLTIHHSKWKKVVTGTQTLYEHSL